MSTKQWADYQRQVARERMQKWRARAAATEATAPVEEVSTEDAEEEEVRRDVGGSSSLHDKYIYSMNAAVKPKLSKWMDRFSHEEIEMLDMEHEGKFGDNSTELGSILEDFVSTLLPGYRIAQLHARLGPMDEPAYFEPQKSTRSSRNSQRLAESIDYKHWRLVVIAGMVSVCIKLSGTDVLVLVAVDNTMRITLWTGSETFVKYTESTGGEQYVSEHGRCALASKSLMVNAGEAFVCDPSCAHQVFATKVRWILMLVRHAAHTSACALSQTNVEAWKRAFLLPVHQ
jgi:hypothetical protein